MNELASMPANARRDLLRVLESPSNVRGDVIRQFHELGDDGMVTALTELEADETARAQAIRLLRELEGSESQEPWSWAEVL